MKTSTQIEDEELEAAYSVLTRAKTWVHSHNIGDKEAATVAILIRALELATPELSPQRRATLFYPQEE